MVGLSQGRDHLPLDEVLAAEAAGTIQALVVQSADVLTLAHEEASLGQLTSTNWRQRQRQRDGGQATRDGESTGIM